MCGFTLGTCFSSTWGEGVYIAMQRKILAVEKCVCYQGKRSFKGESSQMKKQILEVSGELRMLKLQVINLVVFFFFFHIWEAKTNDNNSFLYPQDRAAAVPAVSTSAAQCSSNTLDGHHCHSSPSLTPGILHKAPHARFVHFYKPDHSTNIC